LLSIISTKDHGQEYRLVSYKTMTTNNRQCQPDNQPIDMESNMSNTPNAMLKITDKRQAFRIENIDVETGETVVVIQKGIIGALSNQLKNTAAHRKGAKIIRKLGYVLGECGDMQYGADPSGISENKGQPANKIHESE